MNDPMNEQTLIYEMKRFLNISQDSQLTIMMIHDIAVKRNNYEYNMFCQRFMLYVINLLTEDING